ncbi:MAG: hypothetical protein ACE5LV_00645 [Candidatus Aminicenantales bacterium]
MKKMAVCLIVLFCPILVFGTETAFQSPSFESPYYRIVFPLSVEQEGWSIQGLKVNGQPWEIFFVLKKGAHQNLSHPLEKGDYTIEVDYAWRNGKRYTIEVLYKGKESSEGEKQVVRLKSPDRGGIPFKREGFYRVFRAEEPIGTERRGEICTLTVTVPKKGFEKSGFILADGTRLIPFQMLDVGESRPPEKVAATHPVTLTYRIAFPLDMAPHEKKMLLLLRGRPSKARKKGFVITGEGPGKTVRNNHLSLEFHPPSGQINVIEDRREGVRLFNEAGVVHWNPGVYIPGIAWDHSFNWNPPPSFEEIVGEHLYISTRRGPLQRIKDVDLEVRYVLEADAPYFLSETLLTVKKDLGVSAIRNDEMVLYKGLFDTLVYKDKKGQIVRKPLQENPSFPDGLVHVAPDDVEWVGLLNSEKKFGFISLRLASAHPSPGTSGAWLNKPGTYFYAPSAGKYVYWVRPLCYTWSEHTTRNLLTHVPAGSLFYEKNAYVLLPEDEALGKTLESLLRRLKNPVRVY